jgi:hypothetical protein
MDLFMHLAEQRRAIKPRVIDSSKLRLMKDAQSKTGHALYCIHDRQVPNPHSTAENQESLEKIH